MTNQWHEPICTRCERSRSSGDCAILALVAYLGMPYEDVLSIASGVAVFPHLAGLYSSQISQVAGILGVKLKRVSLARRKRIDWDTLSGIVDMICKQNRTDVTAHVVVVRHGLFFDAEQVWLPEDFIRHYRADIRGILVLQGE